MAEQPPILTLYKSSAGSGKTFTLVQEYLKLVLPQPNRYRSILAVTFTNKATEEMKSRIIETLAELSTAPAEELRQKPQYLNLRAHFDEKGHVDLDIAHQARQVLNRILNDYSNFSVSTIESFFQSIVRAFARELNIALSYEIEMRTDRVLEQLVDALFLELGQDQRLTELLEGYVARHLAEEKGWNIEREIQSLGKQIFQERYQQLSTAAAEQELLPANPMQATLELAAALQVVISQYEATARQYAEQAKAVLDKYGLEVAQLKNGASGAFAMANKTLTRNEFEAPGTRAQNGYDNPNEWYGKSGKSAPFAEAIQAALDDGLWRAHQALIDHHQQSHQRYQTARQVLKSIYTLGLLDRLKEQVEEFRRENSTMLISDTGFLLRQVIGNDEDYIPFIYEKVGTRYQHYLLDEFQDTSSLQWQNLAPLLTESLANGEPSLIVGDAKQSIYRWRNGNMKLLLEQVEADFPQNAQVQALTTNYRTARDIVEFNNRFFVEAQERLCQALQAEVEPRLFGEAYGAVEQTPKKAETPGYVSIAFLEEDKKEGIKWKDLALQRTLDTIRQLLSEGFQGQDLTLLTRTNQDGVLLAEFLQKHGIKVMSAESLLIASHPGVQLMLALLRHLNHENEAITRAALAQFYQAAVVQQPSDHALFLRSQDTNDSVLPPAFEARKDALRRLSVYECAERLLRLFPGLAEPNAYVQGFMDLILEYSAGQDASIAGFLSWWDEKACDRAIVSNQDPDAVEILTIHKSKGLEFPIVILPFCDWEMEPKSSGILWVTPTEAPFTTFPYLPVNSSSSLKDTLFAAEYQQERLESYLDNLNLLYVAFTRPKCRLYAFTNTPGKSAQKNGDLKHIHQLLFHQLPALGMQVAQEETGACYTLGQPQAGADALEASGPTGNLSLQNNPDPLTDWNQAIRIRYHAQRFLNVDQISRHEKIDTGKLMHEALAYVETQADLLRAIEALIQRGLLARPQAAQLEDQLRRVIAHPDAAAWYDGTWQVRNEAEIITDNGQLLIPDRVMVKGPQAVVVDYKTGQPFPAHQKQVKTYQAALQAIGYQTVEGYVYYLNTLSAVSVP